MKQPIEPPHIPVSLVEQVAAIIDTHERQITNRELLVLCEAAGVHGLSTDPHLCHEVAESALNLLVATKYGKRLLSSTDPSTSCTGTLKPLQKRLPTQSWRSATQTTYQQFSTPASIAYLASYLLNLNGRDTVLEPSCGTGSLAVWALASGATVFTNEIDARRRRLAKLLGLDPTGHNAEFIDDLMPGNIIPNVILANPPFSSSGGRTERNQSKFGFRHVESALRRLANGGRFAIILGESGSPQNALGRVFWQSLRPDNCVTASIELPGHEYYRNGTTVGVTLILGRKASDGKSDPAALTENHVNISASLVEDAFDQALAAGLRFNSTSE